MVKYEDKDLCKKCGGFCCKKCGCDYAPSDFDKLDLNSIMEKLNEGNISIVSFITFKKFPNGKMSAIPFLYLRARNTDRDVVDLLSLKKTCSMLTDNGCTYSIEERPKGGVNLIPRYPNKCMPHENPFDIVYGWQRYQNTLSKIVKRLTGMTVDAKLREDAKKLFEDVLNKNFDGVNELEILEIKGMIPDLMECFPYEYLEAKKNVQEKKVYIKL